MQPPNQLPIQVALRIKTQIPRNENQCSMWRRIHRHLQQQRSVLFHPVKVPPVAQRIQQRLEPALVIVPFEIPPLAKISLSRHPPPDHPPWILKPPHVKSRLELSPKLQQ